MDGCVALPALRDTIQVDRRRVHRRFPTPTPPYARPAVDPFVPGAVGLLYVERFDEGERAVFVPESSQSITPGVWVRRPLPALIGVRWPRVKTA